MLSLPGSKSQCRDIDLLVSAIGVVKDTERIFLVSKLLTQLLNLGSRLHALIPKLTLDIQLYTSPFESLLIQIQQLAEWE